MSALVLLPETWAGRPGSPGVVARKLTTVVLGRSTPGLGLLLMNVGG
jgi:hypothetical protein